MQFHELICSSFLCQSRSQEFCSACFQFALLWKQEPFIAKHYPFSFSLKYLFSGEQVSVFYLMSISPTRPAPSLSPTNCAANESRGGPAQVHWPMSDPTWPVWTLQLQPGPDGSDHIEFSTGFTPPSTGPADGETEISNFICFMF